MTFIFLKEEEEEEETVEHMLKMPGLCFDVKSAPGFPHVTKLRCFKNRFIHLTEMA